jgi:hypothetical protein
VKRKIDERTPRPGEHRENGGVRAARERRRVGPKLAKGGVAPHPFPRQAARAERREGAIGRRQMKMLIAGHRFAPTNMMGRSSGRSLPSSKGAGLMAA